MFRCWTSVILALIVTATYVTSLPGSYAIQRRASKCNGYQDLCNRKYSNVTHIGAHDSYAVGKLGSLGSNQEANVTVQLEDGIRLLQIQTHASSGHQDSNPSGLSLCHTSCALKNGGTLESYLRQVKQFLDQNKNEIVTLVITNPDNKPVSNFAKAFENTGLNSMAYRANSNSISKNDWPTLQDLISQNQRVVAFLDYKADVNQAKYILPEFQNIWENPYDQTSSNFNCTPDRYIHGTQNKMYLINHFKNSKVISNKISSPDTDHIKDTNSVSSILKDANHCARQQNAYPTFVLVDYYSQGNGSVFKALAKLNGVTYEDKELNANQTQDGDAAVGPLHVSLPILLGAMIGATTAILI